MCMCIWDEEFSDLLDPNPRVFQPNDLNPKQNTIMYQKMCLRVCQDWIILSFSKGPTCMQKDLFYDSLIWPYT